MVVVSFDMLIFCISSCCNKIFWIVLVMIIFMLPKFPLSKNIDKEEIRVTIYMIFILYSNYIVFSRGVELLDDE